MFDQDTEPVIEIARYGDNKHDYTIRVYVPVQHTTYAARAFWNGVSGYYVLCNTRGDVCVTDRIGLYGAVDDLLEMLTTDYVRSARHHFLVGLHPPKEVSPRVFFSI